MQQQMHTQGDVLVPRCNLQACHHFQMRHLWLVVEAW
jgi:hypothetical protein